MTLALVSDPSSVSHYGTFLPLSLTLSLPSCSFAVFPLEMPLLVRACAFRSGDGVKAHLFTIHASLPPCPQPPSAKLRIPHFMLKERLRTATFQASPFLSFPSWHFFYFLAFFFSSFLSFFLSFFLHILYAFSSYLRAPSFHPLRSISFQPQFFLTEDAVRK